MSKKKPQQAALQHWIEANTLVLAEDDLVNPWMEASGACKHQFDYIRCDGENTIIDVVGEPYLWIILVEYDVVPYVMKAKTAEEASVILRTYLRLPFQGVIRRVEEMNVEIELARYPRYRWLEVAT